jgi:hypothetical protein
MKLYLIFIVMDLLTLIAYPFVFTYGKLHQFALQKANIARTKLLAADPAA